MSQRQDILDAIDARLWAAYGQPAANVADKFRTHRVGPMAPVKMFPSYTLVDAGETRDEDPANQNNESEGRLLAVRLVLHICATWERETEDAKWRDRVEAIKALMVGRISDCGVLEMMFEGDDPVDMVFLSGAVNGVWVIDWRVKYVVNANQLVDWDDA